MNKCLLNTLFLGLAVVALAGFGCSKSAEEGKIPITTKSDVAKSEFLQGRAMMDQIRVHEAAGHFEKAVEADSTFAMAELYLAQSSATTAEFLAHLKKAEELSNNASEGERLIILAAQAQSVGDAAKRQDLLEKLVAAYPKDERAQTQLAGYFSNQREYPKAIEHYAAASQIAPDFAPPYNALGYSYRAMEKYPEAENAFKKYIELVPSDPNPYDSYAELLMKEGKFDQSIDNYKMALTKDPDFMSSKAGIAFDHLYLGKTDEAEAELKAMLASARDEGERGTARFDLVVFYVDRGDIPKALQWIDSSYAEADKEHRTIDMAQSLGMKVGVLQEAGQNAAAKEISDRVMAMISSSSLSSDIKDAFARGDHFNAALRALAAGKMADAKTNAEQLESLVKARPNPARERSVHELYGRIALAGKDYDKAIEEFQQADMESPYIMYQLALANRGKGDNAKAKEYCTKAAHYYSVPDLDYAFVRAKADKMLATM
jgi:tetratricopeptide (TPR) repeat protein